MKGHIRDRAAGHFTLIIELCDSATPQGASQGGTIICGAKWKAAARADYSYASAWWRETRASQ